MTWKHASHCVLATILSTGAALAQGKYAFAAIGDMPYSPVVTAGTDNLQSYPALSYERVIADINSDENNDKIDFTVHIGDIKAGNTRCDNNVYAQNLTYFNSFKRGVIYTPGDNEWTDCHRANNGGYDPLDRLALLRSTFYTSNLSLGIEKIALTRQPDYPENVRWVRGPVLFVALHQPGSNNNLGRTPAMDAEYAARNAANMNWLSQAFSIASADPEIKGVAVFSQANPFERFLEPGQGYLRSGYADFIVAMRSFAQNSGKRLVYFGGDTHYMRIDQPLTGTYPACPPPADPAIACTPAAVPGSPTDRVNSFTRIEVFAQNDVHWIKVEVDKDDPGIFKFTPRRVPGN